MGDMVGIHFSGNDPVWNRLIGLPVGPFPGILYSLRERSHAPEHDIERRLTLLHNHHGAGAPIDQLVNAGSRNRCLVVYVPARSGSQNQLR